MVGSGLISLIIFGSCIQRQMVAVSLETSKDGRSKGVYPDKQLEQVMLQLLINSLDGRRNRTDFPPSVRSYKYIYM